jgi:hypothetical protein
MEMVTKVEFIKDNEKKTGNVLWGSDTHTYVQHDNGSISHVKNDELIIIDTTNENNPSSVEKKGLLRRFLSLFR